MMIYKKLNNFFPFLYWRSKNVTLYAWAGRPNSIIGRFRTQHTGFESHWTAQKFRNDGLIISPRAQVVIIITYHWLISRVLVVKKVFDMK